MMRHSLNLLTLMLDVFLLSVLQFSFIECPSSRLTPSSASSRRRLKLQRVYNGKRVFPSAKRFRLTARLRQLQGGQQAGNAPSSAAAPAGAPDKTHKRKRSLSRAWDMRRTASARNYRYPPMMASIERIMTSGLGVEPDGVWNAGLLLRLGITQLLSASSHYGLSTLTQCLFIAEVTERIPATSCWCSFIFEFA